MRVSSIVEPAGACCFWIDHATANGGFGNRSKAERRYDQGTRLSRLSDQSAIVIEIGP
jgi:hypothetical protein